MLPAESRRRSPRWRRDTQTPGAVRRVFRSTGQAFLVGGPGAALYWLFGCTNTVAWPLIPESSQPVSWCAAACNVPGRSPITPLLSRHSVLLQHHQPRWFLLRIHLALAMIPHAAASPPWGPGFTSGVCQSLHLAQPGLPTNGKRGPGSLTINRSVLVLVQSVRIRDEPSYQNTRAVSAETRPGWLLEDTNKDLLV